MFNNCRTPKIDEVLWLPPLFGWFKVNIDDLSKGNPGLSVATGVFEITQVLLLPLDALALDRSSNLQGLATSVMSMSGEQEQQIHASGTERPNVQIKKQLKRRTSKHIRIPNLDNTNGNYVSHTLEA